MHKKEIIIFLSLLLIIFAVASTALSSHKKSVFVQQWTERYQSELSRKNQNPDFYQKLSEAALARTKAQVTYKADYIKINYPMGDVPPTIGVCTDVVIRSYRALGIDLQQLVHEDMSSSFEKYPNIWGLRSTDTNIDHRRVPNLMTFFSRKGEVLPLSQNPEDYKAGDIVAWELIQGTTHIGLVVDRFTRNGKRPLVVHNIGAGPKLEDALFVGRIIGHFRFDNGAS
jgi:uncharacterized protein YijF (DUF1287 family)